MAWLTCLAAGRASVKTGRSHSSWRSDSGRRGELPFSREASVSAALRAAAASITLSGGGELAASLPTLSAAACRTPFATTLARSAIAFASADTSDSERPTAPGGRRSGSGEALRLRTRRGDASQLVRRCVAASRLECWPNCALISLCARRPAEADWARAMKGSECEWRTVCAQSERRAEGSTEDVAGRQLPAWTPSSTGGWGIATDSASEEAAAAAGSDGAEALQTPAAESSRRCGGASPCAAKR